MIFYVIFGDFVGWDWGTPAILQQKHPWKNWIKIWDWQTPPHSWGKNPNFSKKIQFEGSPSNSLVVFIVFQCLFDPFLLIICELPLVQVCSLM